MPAGKPRRLKMSRGCQSQWLNCNIATDRDFLIAVADVRRRCSSSDAVFATERSGLGDGSIFRTLPWIA